tara:strand:- start:387 stop:563 length:177 start_codon:yes stop_codon:yes gene_type:complete
MYKITRLEGGVHDDITSQTFPTYDDAYDLLAKIHKDVCYSDADYEERPYCEIIETKIS